MTTSLAPSSGPFYSRIPLLLASASPRRREFLRLLGLDFTVVRPGDDEPPPLAGEHPAGYAARAAEAKVRAALALHPDLCATAPVLGADTVVALEGKILGKPRDAVHALEMLCLLSGKTHEVISACFCRLPGKGAYRIAAAARVRFFPWPQEILAGYAATDEVLDKAGAYAVQGKGVFLVERMEGSASAVIGLPVAELTELLLRLDVIAPRTGVTGSASP